MLTPSSGTIQHALGIVTCTTLISVAIAFRLYSLFIRCHRTILRLCNSCLSLKNRGVCRSVYAIKVIQQSSSNQIASASQPIMAASIWISLGLKERKQKIVDQDQPEEQKATWVAFCLLHTYQYRFLSVSFLGLPARTRPNRHRPYLFSLMAL